MTRLWTEHSVSGEYMAHNISKAVMYPKPFQQPRMPLLLGGYVDRVLKRAAVKGDGWLTYFYTPEDFKKSWDKIRNFGEEAGKNPDELMNASQLPICIGETRAAVEDKMMDWLNKEWDFPENSDCKRESAVMGNVDDCVAQLQAQIDAGVQKIIFVPYKYEMDQVETIAKEIIPRLRKR